MTDVTLERTAQGLFASCKAAGHAGAGVAGSDIVCSAVTVLLRTAMQVLKQTDGITLEAAAKEKGQLSFSVRRRKGDAPFCNEDVAARLVCAADFVANGMRSLEAEFPSNVRFEERFSEGE